MNSRTFFVSKSDENKLKFIDNYLKRHNVSNVFIICEENRKHIFKDIPAFTVGFKDLNKSSNWIRFVNDLNKDTLLIVDNIVKFMFFGDGKKKYIKELSQSINNKIMLDVVPFFTEPYEIFYPFWFLGKEILGYNNLQSFKANHLEELDNGSEGNAHDFETLRDKIKDYYIQDYSSFFKERNVVEWQLSEYDILSYEKKKDEEINSFTNPVKLYNSCSTAINLIETKFKKVAELSDSLTEHCIVINCLGKYPKMFKKYMRNKNVNFLSVHSSPNSFKEYKNIILAEMPIVKPHSWMYIESTFTENQNIYQLNLTNNKLEQMFYSKIFKNETRKQFDSYFYHDNL